MVRLGIFVSGLWASGILLFAVFEYRSVLRGGFPVVGFASVQPLELGAKDIEVNVPGIGNVHAEMSKEEIEAKCRELVSQSKSSTEKNPREEFESGSSHPKSGAAVPPEDLPDHLKTPKGVKDLSAYSDAELEKIAGLQRLPISSFSYTTILSWLFVPLMCFWMVALGIRWVAVGFRKPDKVGL